MSATNTELDGIMRVLGLSCADAVQELNIPLETVERWTCADRNQRFLHAGYPSCCCLDTH